MVLYLSKTIKDDSVMESTSVVSRRRLPRTIGATIAKEAGRRPAPTAASTAGAEFSGACETVPTTWRRFLFLVTWAIGRRVVGSAKGFLWPRPFFCMID